MKRHRRFVSLVLPALVLLTFVVGTELFAQGSKGNFPLAVRGAQTQQNSVKVDTSTTPQRLNIGCETDQENTLTVNGLRIVGAATTVAPSITAVPCTGGDTNIGITLTPAGTGPVTLGGSAAPVFAGEVTTHTVFFAAPEFCRSDIPSASLVVARIAAGDWALARTAAGAETYNIRCVITLPWRTTASKGAKITAFRIAQQITVAALTSNTFNDLSTVTYVNNTANAVADHGGTVTITMPTATQANPYLTAGTVGTPAYMTTANAQVVLEWTIVMQNTGVYRLYGVGVTYSTALY